MPESGTLSTEHQRPGDARKPKDTLDRNQTPEVHDPEGRGVRAHVDAETGEVKGSGSGAGGGNPGEDYDDDAAAGGGVLPETRRRPPVGGGGSAEG